MMRIEVGIGPLMRTTPIVGVMIIAAIGFCWIFLLSGMNVGVIDMLGEPMQMPTPVNMVIMWWVMMLAMMLPGTVGHLPVASGIQKSVIPSSGPFILGYGSVWFGYSLVVTAMQYGLIYAGILHPMEMASTSTYFNIAVLSIAGLYQFTQVKAKNLKACQRRQPKRNSVISGLAYGVHCLTASIALMCLLFVGGVMNIYWIVALTLIVVVEKTLMDPRTFSTVVGLSCLLTAALIAFRTI